MVCKNIDAIAHIHCGHNDCFSCPYSDCIVDNSVIYDNNKAKARAKQYYEAHKDERKAYMRQYYEAHKDNYKVHDKQYYEAHKAYMRQYRAAKKKAREAATSTGNENNTFSV